MTDDRDLNDILATVHEPLPLRGDTEDRLLVELLTELDKGALLSEQATPPDIGPLVPRADTEPRPAYRSTWLLRAAAVVLVLAGLAWLAQTDTTSDSASQPDVMIVEPTPTPTPRWAALADACRALVESSPDRDAIRQAVALTPAQADELFDALDTLADDLARRNDIGRDRLDDVRFLRGVALQLRSEVDAGESGWTSWELIDGGLRRLAERDDRFAACWPT